MAIFADDTSIMKANTRDQLNLQTDLAKINDWFCYNKLTINTDKCETRQERLKSALYLRLKKREVFKIVKGDSFGFLKIQFVAKYQENWRADPLGTLKKIENFFEVFEKMRTLKQSHSAKLERGDPLGFLKLQFAAKYQKTWRGEKSKKKSHSAEKKFKGGTL